MGIGRNSIRTVVLPLANPLFFHRQRRIQTYRNNAFLLPFRFSDILDRRGVRPFQPPESTSSDRRGEVLPLPFSPTNTIRAHPFQRPSRMIPVEIASVSVLVHSRAERQARLTRQSHSKRHVPPCATMVISLLGAAQSIDQDSSLDHCRR